jgi:uncharacterized protein
VLSGKAVRVRDAAGGSIFCLPVGQATLLHAPLHGLTALLRNDAPATLRTALRGEGLPSDERMRWIATRLIGPARDCPRARSGQLSDPLFLGIIPTRDCNMACEYCDFASRSPSTSRMDRGVARAAVDAFLALLADGGHQQGQIHFFGGEPLRAADVVGFVVEYATLCAENLGIDLHFEATTNGLFSPARAHWVADAFDSIVLSLDGPPEIQNHQRPALNHQPSFDVVFRTAKILSEGSAQFAIRSCVTSATVDHLPQWAHWISRELQPDIVCLESLTPSKRSVAAGLFPPDPYRFAREFASSARILAACGIDAVQSMSDPSGCRVSACPVGRDALIVSPDGVVNGCYLPENQWRDRGLDLRLGHVDGATGRMEIEEEALESVRGLPGRDKPLCANCYCRYHCAGGCHVHHDTDRPPASYDDLCIATRLITADRLLRGLHHPEVSAECLHDASSAAALAQNSDDRLLACEVM